LGFRAAGAGNNNNTTTTTNSDFRRKGRLSEFSSVSKLSRKDVRFKVVRPSFHWRVVRTSISRLPDSPPNSNALWNLEEANAEDRHGDCAEMVTVVTGKRMDGSLGWRKAQGGRIGGRR
jgi:hypothetical protein